MCVFGCVSGFGNSLLDPQNRFIFLMVSPIVMSSFLWLGRGGELSGEFQLNMDSSETSFTLLYFILVAQKSFPYFILWKMRKDRKIF